MMRTLALMAFVWFLSDVAPVTEWHFWAITFCVIVALIAERER